MKKFLKAVTLTCMMSALTAHADVVIKDAWVRATVPQQQATGAFMQIQSPRHVRLVEVQTAVAGVAEVHEMQMENNVMKMRAMNALDIPAGKSIELKPGAYHIMLMNLKNQARAGETVILKLTFEDDDKKREVREVKASVREMTVMQHKM
ncbi:copper chaperone PCu(A)C [Undibacterium oligocarboniphilum]|uniref:Copper chaperone PCu(A)C n=2 Tax=Undibacterium oligocarboniphilum TaxID=666702 RepID=A0A850QKI0_9BURK|nr:copper chaperone PCu(A)C [Undibacterium oligocarboniphilum]NVO76914.1 copper chaperone PCu(A)C [Undibacterium oligocarboniphilum]